MKVIYGFDNTVKFSCIISKLIIAVSYVVIISKFPFEVNLRMRYFNNVSYNINGFDIFFEVLLRQRAQK